MMGPSTEKIGAPAKSAGPAALGPAELVRLYRFMLLTRILDERMLTLQRQGRIGFYGACTGQEAASLGAAAVLEPGDWVFPALREGTVMLLRGYPLVPYLAQIFGNLGDPMKGRQMPCHQAARSVHQVSWSSCIGTQLPHAVGVAWAAKHKGDRAVAMAFLGDGATSSADFHVAMNFAGVSRAPVVFVCQNNHWSISLHRASQTASVTLAAKAVAYGMDGARVDGNDVEAVYAAAAEAVARARDGEGPTLIEAETYRMGAHSSSDDPSRYRDENEVAQWAARDPIARLSARLLAANAWDPERDRSLRAELAAEVNAAISAVERLGPPETGTLFEDVYGTPPWHLKEEKVELQREAEANRG